MENVDELRREAENVKERLKRDVLELRNILSRAAIGIAETSQIEAEEAVKHAERRIEETVSRIEQRFEKAICLVADCCPPAAEVASIEINITGFSNIEADSAFRVDIVRGDSQRVSVCADKALMDYLNVSKSGNTLRLSLKPHRFQSRPVVEARIALPNLNKVRLGAATRAVCHGFDSGDSLDLNLSGSSSCDLDIKAGNVRCEVSGASRLSGKIAANSIEFVLSGASRAELNGNAQKVTLSAWGASIIEMAKFQIAEAEIHLKGASEADITTTDNIEIDLSSGSHLTYSGDPNIRSISVTGASSLSHR